MDFSHLLPHLPHLSNLLSDASGVIGTSARQACGANCNTGTSIQTFFSKVIGVLIFLIGSVSVLMIIIGGLRYILSNGDPKAAEAAKNTILYSVVGVIVAIAAFAIVNFVVTSVR